MFPFVMTLVCRKQLRGSVEWKCRLSTQVSAPSTNTAIVGFWRGNGWNMNRVIDGSWRRLEHDDIMCRTVMKSTKGVHVRDIAWIPRGSVQLTYY